MTGLNKLTEAIGNVLFAMVKAPRPLRMIQLCAATNAELDLVEQTEDYYRDDGIVATADNVNMSQVEARVLAHAADELDHVERTGKDPEFIAAMYGTGEVVSADALAVSSGDYDPDALRRAMEDTPTLATPRMRSCACGVVMRREDRKCIGCGAALSRLRDRVRSKPLTESDIVVGGEYVPKRGNDKTPNYVVVSRDGRDIWANRSNEPRAAYYPLADFLALVSRRVDA